MSPFGATILRVILGMIYVAHAYNVFFVVTTDAMAAMINAKLGFPFGDALAIYLVAAQLIGGIMLILGLWTRWAAFVNIPIMLVAVVLVQLGDGFFPRAVIVDVARQRADVVGYEYSLLVLCATVAQFFLGGGAVAFTKDT